MALTSEIGIKLALQGAEAVTGGLAGVGRAVDGIASKAGTLRDALGSFAPTLAAAFSVGGIATFVKATADAIDKLNDVADATGSTIEEISKLERVAKLSGASLDTVGGALVKFNSALKEAKPGSGIELALKSIGLEAAKLRELDPSVALRQTAQALAGFADDGNKARLVQELFGKSLREVAPLLKDIAEAGDVAATVTAQQAAEAEKFNRSVAALQTSASEAARAIAAGLLPTLQAVFDVFTSAADGARDFSGIINAIKVPIQALTVLGANVAFVFEAVGREIGAIAAQSVALAKLDFKGFRAISEAVIEDGKRARAELDALEQRLLGIRNAGGGRGFVNPETVRPSVVVPPDVVRASTAEIDRNAEAIKRLNASLDERLAIQARELQQGDALSEAQRLEVKLNQDLLDGTLKLTKAEEDALRAKLGQARAGELLLKTQREEARLREEARRAADASATSELNKARSLEERVVAQREAVAAIGLEGIALADLEVARLRDAAATAEQNAQYQELSEFANPKLIAAYRQQAAALRELADLRITGATKQAAVDGAREAAADMRRTFDQVSQSLADALLNGGKSAGEALRRYFKTLILQPIIKAIVNPVAGAITGALGFAGAANASTVSQAAGAGNLLSGLSSAYSAITGNFITGLGSVATSIGNTIGSTAIAEFGLGLQGLALPSSTGALAAGGNVASAVAGGLQTAAAAAPYVAAAVVALNALGVFRSTRTTDVGLVGTLGAGSINDATVIRRGGSLFNGPEYRTEVGAISAASATLQQAFDGLRNTAVEQAKALGISNDAIKTFTVRIGNDILNNDAQTFGLSLKDLSPEQQQAKITEALNSANESLAKFVLGTDAFTRSGETAVQTLARLSGSIGGVNQVLGALGLQQFNGLAGADAASGLADRFGGVAGFQQTAAEFFEAFYSEAERTSVATRQLTESLAKLGIDALPATREAYRDLVEAQDLTTESGRATFAGLLQLSGAFAELVPASEALAATVRSAADILQERQGLEQQLLQLQGNTTELRRLEREALDESNRALFDQITALQDQKTAAEEAARSFEAVQNRILGGLPAFIEAFYSEAERDRIAREQFSTRFVSEAASGTFGGTPGELNALLAAATTGTGDLRALYRQLVEAQDLSTASGRNAVAVLLELAPAFSNLVPAAEAAVDAVVDASKALRERESLELRLLQLQGNTTELRARERAALDETNRALFDTVTALEDAAAAAQRASAAAAASASQRANLEDELLRLLGKEDELNARRRDSLDPANQDLFDQILEVQKQQQAAAAAAQRAQAAQAAAAQRAQERAGIERRLLQLQGDTLALRRLELKAVDESNRALLQRVFALEDEQKAAEAAKRIRDEYSSVADSLIEVAKRLRDELGGGDTFASLQAKFAVTSAQARAGDLNAARSLGGLANDLIASGADNATSGEEFRLLRARIAGSLEGTAGLLKGELTDRQIQMESLEEQRRSGQVFAAVRDRTTEMVLEQQALRDDQRLSQAQIASVMTRVAKVLERWDVDGYPEQRTPA